MKMVVLSAGLSWLWNQLRWIYSKQLKKKKKAAFVERDEKSQEEIAITISSDFYLQEII